MNVSFFLVLIYGLASYTRAEPQGYQYRKQSSRQRQQNQIRNDDKPQGRLFFDGLNSLLPFSAPPVRRRIPIPVSPVSYDPCLGRSAPQPQGRFLFTPNVFNVRRYPAGLSDCPSSYYDTYADPRPRPPAPLPQTVNDGLLNFLSIFGKPPSQPGISLSQTSEASQSSLVEPTDPDDIFDSVTENSPVQSDPASSSTRYNQRRSSTNYRRRSPRVQTNVRNVRYNRRPYRNYGGYFRGFF